MEARSNRYTRLKEYLVGFNLFETDSTEQHTIYIERWSTRVYIGLLFSTMSILLAYNTLTIELQQIQVTNPSLETYLKLQNTYNTDINCPCTRISTLYSSFVQVIPKYHEICFSGFVSEKWINLLFDNTSFTRYAGDFRASSSNQFQVLREVCNLSQTAISSDIETFYNGELTSSYLLRQSLLEAKIKAIVAAFKASSVQNFMNTFSFIHLFVKGNQLVPGILTSTIWRLYTTDYENWGVFGTQKLYSVNSTSSVGPCYCKDVTICSTESAIYQLPVFDHGGSIYLMTDAEPVPIDNWFVTCLPMESLLLSSFDNSFVNNQTELDVIAINANWASNLMPAPLTLSEESSNQTRTFNDLLNIGFLENFTTGINYSLYFMECRPLSCLYSINQHSSFLYMFTALLGLYGGLSVVFRLCVPYLVAFLTHRLKRSSQQHVVLDVGKFKLISFQIYLW